MFLKNTNKSLLKKTHRPLPEIILKSDIHKNIENKELNGTVGIKDNIPSFSISRTNSVDIELKTINYVNGTILEYSGNTSQLHSDENKASNCINDISNHICHCVLCKKKYDFKSMDEHNCNKKLSSVIINN